MSTATVAGVEVDTRHWIGGRRVASAQTFDDVSPIDGTVIAQVSRGGGEEVEAAVEPPRTAFRDLVPDQPAGAGGRPAPDRRRRREAHRGARPGRDPRQRLAAAFAPPRRDAAGRDELPLLRRPPAASSRPRTDWQTRGHRNHVTWDPAGVTAVVTPWNAPLMLATWRIAPALAAGNTVVAKPPEWAPLTASLLADIAAEAGLPDGVLNVVQGFGAEAGAPLVAHPERAADQLHRQRSDGAADRRGGRRQRDAGELRARRQVAAARPRRRRPRPRRRPRRRAVRQRRAGVPGRRPDPGPGVGRRRVPASAFLARAEALAAARATRGTRPRRSGRWSRGAHLERVDGFVQRARHEGARVVLGGESERRAQRGDRRLLLPPDRLRGRRPDSEIVCREVFGPVLTLQTFGGEEEGIAMANDTEYGLAATLVTGNPERAERVSAQLDAGTVWVNCFFVRDLAAPFGGNGHSGIGREGGTWSFDFYCDVKNSVFAPQGWRQWVRSSAPACWRTSPRSCCRSGSGGSSTTARTSRLVPGLERLRREVFDTLDYDTVVVLDSHWATTVEFVVTAQPRRAGPVHQRGAAARHVPHPLRLARRPRARARDGRRRAESARPG